VQFVQIIISIVRSKILAVLLGPAGIGISGLFQMAISLVTSFSNFGLTTSAIKSINTAIGKNDSSKISKSIVILRKLVWFTGCLGMGIFIIFSKVFSELNFGNSEYTTSFVILSVTLLLGQISSGQGVLLRAFRKVDLLAKSSIIGSILGLIFSIPLFYYFGIQGIVPSIVGSSIFTLVLTWYFAKKIRIEEKVEVGLKEVFHSGREMLSFGFLISLSGIFNLFFSYLIRIYIRHVGTVDEVGLYSAGFTIINTYLNLIFTAMSTDYYPRLSQVNDLEVEVNKTINQQIEMALLLITPLLLIFILFIKLIIVSLYSSSFIQMDKMLMFCSIGMAFKAVSWSIGFVFLAKGVKRLFLINEVISTVYMFAFNVVGFYFWGLNGLGISFIISYLIHFLQVYFVSKIYFNFNFEIEVVKVFLTNIIILSICLFSQLYFEYSYILKIILIITSFYFNFSILNKRLDLRAYFSKYF
jgi:O-antigen/teichoic acid export membrane protein